jgi:hypothetical protein
VFENRALRRIFGPKRDEVAGDWRKLRSEELRNLFSTPSIIRMIDVYLSNYIIIILSYIIDITSIAFSIYIYIYIYNVIMFHLRMARRGRNML